MLDICSISFRLTVGYICYMFRTANRIITSMKETIYFLNQFCMCSELSDDINNKQRKEAV